MVPTTNDILIDSAVRVAYLGVMMYAQIKIGYSNRFDSVRKWRKYVLVVIQDRIRDLEK